MAFESGLLANRCVEADCWLAAENLMLAATAKGLGTCCIGFAVGILNTEEVKRELGIPEDGAAVAPDHCRSTKRAKSFRIAQAPPRGPHVGAVTYIPVRPKSFAFGHQLFYTKERRR